jgi:guanylate kinase
VRRGRVFVIAAPSGTGKTTICRALVDSDPRLRFSVSHTTRAPRPGERDGVHYHFVAAQRFHELVAQGAFLEYAEYGGNLYGTSLRALEEPLAEGCDVILEIEVQGARQIRESGREACFVFLLPPSLDALRERLATRGADGPEAIERRLAIARRELAAAELFDYAVVNDRLERALADVRRIVQAVRTERTGELADLERARVLARWPERAPRA